MLLGRRSIVYLIRLYLHYNVKIERWFEYCKFSFMSYGKEKIVIPHYFGIGGSKQKNLQEIACELQLTGERIRQIKARSLQRLRHVTRSQLLKIYIG